MRWMYTLLSIGILFIVFISHGHVHAQNDRMEDVKIYVTVHEDGSAFIREERIEHNYTGTERYIVKENLGKSEIKDFFVSMNDQAFTHKDDWDIAASFDEKAYKSGVIETKDGYELIWGTTETGRQKFVLEYRVTNFIKQLKDAQVIYWNFFFEDVGPERIRLEIEAPKVLHEDSEKVWGFGFPGTVNFENGKIIAYNTKGLEGNHYLALLVQFEDGVFSSGEKVNRTFASLQKEAFKDSDYKEATEISLNTLFIIVGIVVLLVIGIIGILAFIIVIGLIKGRIQRDKRVRFKRKYKEEYYRDPPYEKFYLHYYYITYQMGLSDFKTILTSLLLKWIKEERIHIEEHEGEGIFRRAKAKITIVKPMGSQSLEGRLFVILNQIAGDKGYLYDIDLSRWANRNFERLDSFERLVMGQSKLALERDGLVNKRMRRIVFAKATEYSLTANGEKSKENAYKYVNYLHDFSLLNEHEAVNVHIWDDMMIWASFLNLTDEVQKQFKKLYPSYDHESIYKAATVKQVNDVVQRTDKSRRSGKSDHRRNTGGGGSTSVGGGSSAYGGGRSGGRR